MSEKFTEKAIHQFNGYKFHIPSYQRGYRWDRDQVTDLLNDLLVFIESRPGPEEAYWLQPVVVKSLDQEGHYELIDGQQRLTTLYLLRHFLAEKVQQTRDFDKYELYFDKRDVQDDFVRNNKFFDPSDNKWRDNIDTFYMQRAYDEIVSWFKNACLTYGYSIQNDFIDLLLNNKRSADIKVIWYELDGEEIAAFERLNHGRISLTGTELVKALLLSTKSTDDEKVTMGEAMNRAHAWDRMEKALQQADFWAMLTGGDDNRLSHIDAVLDIVADELCGELPEKDKRNRKKDGLMFNYFVIVRYLKNHTTSDVWNRVEDTFNRIRNWYDRSDWYNYIALGIRINKAKFSVPELRRLEMQAHSKDGFTNLLRTAVADALKVDQRQKDEKEARKHPLLARKLNYNEKRDILRKILLAANVVTVIREHSGRFPFRLYDNQEIKSLDHIHPQNIGDMADNLTKSEIKQWVYKRLQDIGPDKISKKQKAVLNNYFADDELYTKNNKIDVNDEHWEPVAAIIKKIDEFFGDMANISDDELHSIKNMALVTVAANSALSNNFLNVKRSKLIQRVDEHGEYLMPLTDRVFSKYYTTAAGIDTGDMRLWRREDRDEYLKDLIGIYDYLQ